MLCDLYRSNLNDLDPSTTPALDVAITLALLLGVVQLVVYSGKLSVREVSDILYARFSVLTSF